MSDITWTDKDLGPVDAYALAVAGGYTGTKEQFETDMGNSGTNATTAATKAGEASASALKAEGFAVGKQNNVEVESGDYYHNNAKYYRDSAAAIAAGDVIDDDAGSGDMNLTWSANKLSDLKSAMYGTTDALYFTKNVLCPDYDNTEVGRQFIKKNNVISMVYKSSSAASRTFFFTGTEGYMSTGNQNDCSPTINQLVDIAVIKPNITNRVPVIDYYIDGKYTGSNTSLFSIYYYKIVDGVITKISRESVYNGTKFANQKGYNRYYIQSIPDDAEYFALALTSNGAGTEFTVAMELNYLLVADFRTITTFLSDAKADADLFSGDLRIIRGNLYELIKDATTGTGLSTDTNIKATTIEQQLKNQKDSLLSIDTTFPMAIFKGKSAITDEDAATESNAAIIRYVTFDEPIMLYTDEGYKFNVMRNNPDRTKKSFRKALTKEYIEAGRLFSLTFYKSGGELITLDDISHLHLKCSQRLINELNGKYKLTFSKGALIFPTPESVYDTPIGRGTFDTDAKLLVRTPSYRRVTVEIVAENPFVVMSGYYTTTHPGVYVHKINNDNTITTTQVPELTRKVFEVGRYIIVYYNSNSSSTTVINSYVYIKSIESEDTPTGSNAQLMTPGDQRGQGFFFDENYNIWILKNQVVGENSKMYVRKQNNTYSDMISLGMETGHGNNVTYYGGKMWISDWDNPRIYRFTIDSDELTATYIDTIEMPSEGITGSIEYVPISDNEIIGLAFDAGSGSSREFMWVIKYIKKRTSDTYVQQEKFPVSIHEMILQGAAYYDGYLYALMDEYTENSSIVNRGVQIINMKTHNSVFVPSNYSTESESILEVSYNSISDRVYVIIGYEQGTIYRLVFDTKFLPS